MRLCHAYPLVGVITRIRRSGSPQESRFFRYLQEAGVDYGIRIIFFSPLDADLAGQTVVASRWSKSRHAWVQRGYPLPKVIYDRLFTNGARDARALLSAARAIKDRPGTVLFAERPLNKWRAYEALSPFPELAEHLPITRLYSGARSLERFLATFETVYLKPVHGYQGRSILRLQRVGNRVYCKGRTFREGFRSFRSSPRHLTGAVHRWVANRPFLLQEGLDLRLPNGRACDVRALIQKDRRREWIVTGMGMRVGPCGSVTSNLHGGGTALPVGEGLSILLGDPGRTPEVLDILGNLATTVARVLEQEVGRFGEFGLDFGVDRAGSVWLLECNVKPGRTIFRRLGDLKTRRLSIRRPAAYLSSLAKEALRG